MFGLASHRIVQLLEHTLLGYHRLDQLRVAGSETQKRATHQHHMIVLKCRAVRCELKKAVLQVKTGILIHHSHKRSPPACISSGRPCRTQRNVQLHHCLDKIPVGVEQGISRICLFAGHKDINGQAVLWLHPLFIHACKVHSSGCSTATVVSYMALAKCHQETILPGMY